MKTILIILLMVTACAGYSQGTIEITHEQARQAIKNARAIPVLESQLQAQGLIIANYKDVIVPNLEKQKANLESRLTLSNQDTEIYKTRYEAEKAKKAPKYSLNSFLLDLGKAGLGAVLALLFLR